ncbi:MAG: hypothetical protein V4555_04430 [Acidobacteriota bacterium]
MPPIALLTGCHSHPAAAANTAQVRAAHRAEVDSQRAQLEMILPPSKNRFMAVKSFESWENPYITVQPGMLELHVTLADDAPQSFGTGGMLRPIGARRQVVDISFDKLGEAMTAIPQSSWPYGRVVAIEEAHNTPKAGEPVVRRNMENAIGTLSDLGVEVYDIHDGNLR